MSKDSNLNFVLNSTTLRILERKEEFNQTLEKIVQVNNKIKTLSEYITSLTHTLEEKKED